MNSGGASAKKHIPVLQDAVLSHLQVRSDGIYLDCTVGLGGHASAIQNLLSSKGRLIGLDGDQEAVKYCKQRLALSSHIIRASYDNFPKHISSLGVKQVDGMLLDLGISSYQLDTAERGFSHRNNGPLDMRFDVNAACSAKDIVNDWSVFDLKNLFKKYGQERRASAISWAIANARKKESIVSTGQLKNIIKSVAGVRTTTKTLSRIFQAIRIAVNDELETLNRFLGIFANYLSKGGRIVVISYHSLEDGLVKQTFRELEKGCICPPKFPVCCCDITPSLKMLTKRVVQPTKLEVRINNRARSARLRAMEKI